MNWPIFAFPHLRMLCNPKLVIGLLAFACSLPAYCQVFNDVAPNLNLNAIPNSLQYGSGMSFYDFNKDGWDDLSFTMVDDSLVFYENQGGTFQQLPSFAYGPGRTKHLVWVDYDNDGDLDFGRTTFEGSYDLFQNDGNFNFTNVSEEAGLLQGEERYYGMCFADYDRDGDLDFYVTCYEQLDDMNFFDRLNHLYRNEGDGTFTNVTLEAGVGNGIRLSFKGVWFDYDKDGWPDLFVINDRVFKNTLYHNNGDGTFTDVSEEAGIELGGQDPMTATVGDFDNDSDLDIYMTNTSSVFKRGQLLVNNNDGTFSQEAENYGVDVFGWTWGAVWVDYDNDTDQDLYVAHGHPNLQEFDISNFFLESNGGAFFNDITEDIMVGGDNYRSYSTARGDYNNDGFYDIAVLNRAPHNVNLWQNSTNEENHYIKITLEGTVSNIMAIGSWIRVFVNGSQYTQYTMCGENYIAQNSQHHIFGLGPATVVDSVQIEYVLGHTDTYYNLQADSSYQFIEGETYSAQITTDGPLFICEGDSIVLDAGIHDQYEWNTGYNGRYLSVEEPGTYWFTATNEFGIQTNSDTVTVGVGSIPAIGISANDPLCNGENNGWIQLSNLNGVPPSEVTWDSGDQGAEIDSLGAGIYNYVFTDINGCSNSGEVLLQEPMPLSVQVFTFPEVNGDDGGISLIINGGTAPYHISLDTTQYDISVITGLSAGNYNLTIEDDNGCLFQQLVTVATFTSVVEIFEPTVKIYPNPAKPGGEIRLSCESNPGCAEISQVLVVNALGQEVARNIGLNLVNESLVLDIPKLNPGAYSIQLFGIDGAALEVLPLIIRE